MRVKVDNDDDQSWSLFSVLSISPYSDFAFSLTGLSVSGPPLLLQSRSQQWTNSSSYITYLDKRGTGFRAFFPIALVNEPPNKLRRCSEFLRSSWLLFLLCRLSGAARSSPAEILLLLSLGVATGVESFEWRLAVSLTSCSDAAFSFSEPDSAERPNSRLRLDFESCCATSGCAGKQGMRFRSRKGNGGETYVTHRAAVFWRRVRGARVPHGLHLRVRLG